MPPTMTFVFSLIVFSLVFRGVCGEASALSIVSQDGEDYAGRVYFFENETATFTCMLSSNDSALSWYVRGVGKEPVSLDSTASVYQTNGPSGKVITLNFANLGAKNYVFVCQSETNSSLEATFTVKQDSINSVTSVNSTSICVAWKAIEDVVFSICASRKIVCEINSTTMHVARISEPQFCFSDLNPFTTYLVWISGSSKARPVTTGEGSPSSPPQNVKFVISESSPNVQMTWMIPVEAGRAGLITSYTVKCSGGSSPGKRVPLTSYNFSHPIQVQTELNLQPSETFACSVAAATSAGTGVFSPVRAVTIDFMVLASQSDVNGKVTLSWSIPSVLSGDTNIQRIVVQSRLYGQITNQNSAWDVVYANTTSNTTVFSQFESGKPYEVLVTVHLSYVEISRSIVLFSQEITPRDAVSNLNATALNSTSTRIVWEPQSLNEVGGFPVYRVTLSSGSSRVTYETRESELVVTGLIPSSSYDVRVTVLTKAGPGPVKTMSFTTLAGRVSSSPDPGPPGVSNIVIGAVVAVLAIFVLAIIVAIVVICCLVKCLHCSAGAKIEIKDKVVYDKNVLGEDGVFIDSGDMDVLDAYPSTVAKPSGSDSDSVNTMYINDTVAVMIAEKTLQRVSYVNVKPKVPVSDFINFVNKMKTTGDIATEYQSLPFIDENASFSAAFSNPLKNRYDKIIPYDHSRVTISGGLSDYINASFIDDTKNNPSYIATQGPLPGTIGDFWKMVWDHKSPAIVMLTRLEEGGQHKCVQYWNDDVGHPIQFNSGITVTLQQRNDFSEYVLRTFSIASTEGADFETLFVHHFHFVVWPDHGVPAYAGSILGLVQSVNHYRGLYPASHPIVVHCSAGVGRTGTYIAIDAMVQRLREKDDLNIYEYLQNMRGQRPYMILNMKQYIFLHETMCEYIVNRSC